MRYLPVKYRVLVLAAISFTAVFVVGVSLSIVSHNKKTNYADAAEASAGVFESQSIAVDPSNAAASTTTPTTFCGVEPRSYFGYHHIIIIQRLPAAETTATNEGTEQLTIEYMHQQSLSMLRAPWMAYEPEPVDLVANSVNLAALGFSKLDGVFESIDFDPESTTFAVRLAGDPSHISISTTAAKCEDPAFKEMLKEAEKHKESALLAATQQPTQPVLLDPAASTPAAADAGAPVAFAETDTTN
jgi:hypothetical protein